MIRTSHVIAAFIGMLLIAYARFNSVGSPKELHISNLAIVFLAFVIFGGGWEVIVRLLPLLKRLLAGERSIGPWSY